MGRRRTRHNSIRRGLIGGIAVLLALGAGAVAWAWEAAIPPQPRPAADGFPPELVAEGAQLAAVGNCIACHTVPGGRSFAGGLALPTPFGTIHSTNITPDEDTGIGRWSEGAFTRAMRRGVDREGRHLYPAFPYDHYTRVSDADNRALYAYLMTRTPVRAEAPANDLPFPLNIRMMVAGWKLLYFREGAFTPDPAKPEVWNRGAYLAEGLGHCGACHSPRNALGAVEKDRAWAGGEAEGWTAYPINQDSPAPVPWTADSLAFYLRHGWHPAHGVSRGPMAEVTGNLAGLPDADVVAIAAYVADRMGTPTAERLRRGEDLQALVPRLSADAGTPPGASLPAADGLARPPAADSGRAGGDERGEAIYRAACATCHESGRPLPFGGLPFALSTAVNASTPQNIINVTLFGLPPGDGTVSAVMPAFGGALSDADMVALLRHLRGRFSEQPPWDGLERLVADTRSGAHHVAVRPADGIERAPRNVGAAD